MGLTDINGQTPPAQGFGLLIHVLNTKSQPSSQQASGLFNRNRWNKETSIQVAVKMSDQQTDARQRVPCVFFRRGSCRNGASCPFLHELQPLASNPAANSKAAAPRHITVELKPGKILRSPSREISNGMVLLRNCGTNFRI